MINQYISAGTTFNAAFYNFADENLHAADALDAKPNLTDTVFNTVCTASGDKTPVEIKPTAAIIKAIDALNETLSTTTRNGFVVGCDGSITTQYVNCDGDYTIAHISKSEFRASVCDDYGASRPYILKMSRRDSTDKELPDGIFFGILCYLLYSEDGGIPDWASKSYKNTLEQIRKGSDNVLNAYAVLSEEVRMMLEKAEQYHDSGFAFNSAIITPNPLEIEKGAIEAKESQGEIGRIAVKGKEIGAASSFSSISELAEKYNLHRKLSEEEKRLIPELPETYIIPDKMVYALELISRSDRFRNFILRGPAGTGKTEWCKILAQSLQLPYLFFGCSTDTEKMDLTMSIIPAESGESVDLNSIDPAEWVLDPVMSYTEITGEVKEDATEKDCLMATIAKATSKSGSAFKYVESNLVKAFRNGYVVEVQEPTIMSRPGVLASLNSMFDGCKAVTLVNGETVNRHPDAIVIYTTNTSYEGCVSLNQSALSRMVCIDLNDLSDDKIVERLMNNTGWGNEKAIRKMVAVYRSCIEKAAQEAITDGSIDMRAMEDWALANSITGPGTIYQNGMNMLISKCSNDPSLREEFIGCLETQFKPAD